MRTSIAAAGYAIAYAINPAGNYSLMSMLVGGTIIMDIIYLYRNEP